MLEWGLSCMGSRRDFGALYSMCLYGLFSIISPTLNIVVNIRNPDFGLRARGKIPMEITRRVPGL